MNHSELIQNQTTKCGFVAVIGPPNAGKSTLINHLVGGKVTIVSKKAQTTRSIMRGIVVHNNAQIIFVDTPGIFKPRAGKRLERAMVAAAWQGGEDADMVMLVCDASSKKSIGACLDIAQQLGKSALAAKDTILVLNKIDAMPKEELLKVTVKLNNAYHFKATYMISALKGHGTNTLLDDIAKQMSEGAFLYDPDDMSDAPMRFMAAEITREKLFEKLYDELPYGLTVETEEWEDFDNGDIRIGQLITIERDQHKMIVLGKGGQKIKTVGEAARKELSEILGTNVHLKLHVRVQENWQDDVEKYESMGLKDFMD